MPNKRTYRTIETVDARVNVGSDRSVGKIDLEYSHPMDG